MESDSHRPVTIDTQRNVAIHFCWYKFDMNEETSSGAGTTHSTYSIVMQEMTGEHLSPTESTAQSIKSNERSLEYKHQEKSRNLREKACGT